MEDRVKEKTARLATQYGGRSGGKNYQQASAQEMRDEFRKMYPQPSIDWGGALPRTLADYAQVEPRLCRSGSPREVRHVSLDESSHIRDAWLYGQSAMQTGITAEDPLAKFKDHELIMALLARGYACMRVPESGTPEVLQPK